MSYFHECERCGNRYNWGINGSTLVFEDNHEEDLCNYCMDKI